MVPQEIWQGRISWHLWCAIGSVSVMFFDGSAAGFQSVIDNGRGVRGALYIREMVFSKARHVPVGVGDLVGLGGRR
jgi:hypothetical protein